jgi:hypothetical protein
VQELSQYESEDDENQTDNSAHRTILGDNRIYQIIYSNILYYPVMYILPLVTLTTLNFKLIAALNIIRRRTVVSTSVFHCRPSRHKQNKHDNITYCVVVIVFVFIICQTPALFNQIFWGCVRDNRQRVRTFSLLLHEAQRSACRR